MVSGVFAGVVVAAVGVTTAALVIEPVQLVPVAEVPETVVPETIVPEAESAEIPDVASPEGTAEAPSTEELLDPEEPEVIGTVEPEEAPETVEMVEPEERPTEDEIEAEAAGTLEPVEPAPMIEATPEAAPVEEVPTDTAEAAPEDDAAPRDEEVAQLPMVIAPSNPPREQVVIPESNGTVRAAGQSSFDPPPLEDDTLEEPAPSAPVVTGRLPTIGESAVQEQVDAGPQPAIRANAVPYEGIAELPAMSVLLLDTGPGRENVGDLAVMPFPLSVAVDASSPDAAEAIAFYRANGAEVVLIVPLPEQATAIDVDVTFQAYDPLMTDIVAVMFPPEAGFQGLGDAAAQVVTNLDERGLGLVTYPEGLNTGHRAAISEDLPAGQIFRDLDGDGQTGDVMRRFLDNVAFRARNDAGVIAVARVQPTSIQALLEWSLGNRAQAVNFAPVSAILLDE
ncbi:MAG: divergent polysaccharide deacetylase family protein [Pseudomonadota bacterium]|nr:divergent polysaccharide deacetylase family protein [Pseudomonadota bacterium]